MHDDLERTAESPALSSNRTPHARMEMLDSAGAIALAESMVQSRLVGDAHGRGDVSVALADAQASAEKGERVAVIAPIERLAALRETMRRIAQSRLSIVAHAIAGHGAEDLVALTD